MWNGISNFNNEFDTENIDLRDDLPESPEKAVLVVIPYLDYSDDELAKINQFVGDGGTLLLMDDYGYGNRVLAYLDVSPRFSNKPLLDPLFCYKNQWLPRITHFAPEIMESGIDIIMLNHATALTNVKPEAVTVWSSSSSFLDMDEDETWDEDEPLGPFAVAAEFQLGKGILTLVSDPSIIINTMLHRDDNHDFTRYLTRHKGEDKKVLIDRSHLTKASLDVSKMRLTTIREQLSRPYALLSITAIIFAVVSRYTLKKEKTIE